MKESVISFTSRSYSKLQFVPYSQLLLSPMSLSPPMAAAFSRRRFDEEWAWKRLGEEVRKEILVTMI